MTDQALLVSLSFAAGMMLGAAYFAGLWWMVRRLPDSAYAGALLMGSAVLRVGLLLGAWFWISDGNWLRLLACLGGFIFVRLVATRLSARHGARLDTLS